MSIGEDEFLKSLRATFAIEAGEHLQAIEAGLLALEKAREADEQRRLIETVFRAAHSLKGAARAVNFDSVENVCQSLENAFATWKRQQVAPSPMELDLLHQLLDKAAAILNEPKPATAPAPRPPAVAAPEIKLVASPPPAPPISSPGQPRLGEAPQVSAPNAPALRPSPTNPVPATAAKASPAAVPAAPTESAEKISSPGTVRISVAKLDAQLLQAEELLTAKMANRQRVADARGLAAQLEDWKKEWISIQPELRMLHQTVEGKGAQTAAASSASVVRLVEFTEWTHDCVRALESKIAALGQTSERDHFAVGKLVDDLLADSKKMLMLPVASLSAGFPKLARDLCRDQGKEADLIIRGEEVEIDKRILEEMKDPFIHILRNCIDHGIEKPGQRAAKGKPPRATITFSVSQAVDGKVDLTVSDDGRGIAIDRVKESALQRGLISPEEARGMSDAAAMELIFQPDVSTSPIITQISGRGLGLAIVREKADKLGGRVAVESQLDVGTTIRITLPVAIANFRGVLVEAAKRQFIVPTAQVERVVRFKSADIQTVGGRETLSLGGRAIALARLAQVLELPVARARPEAEAARPALLLRVNDERAAFEVDAILDEQEVLVKRFSKPLLRVRNIAGATVLGSGQVAPILNVADLLKSVRKTGGSAVQAAAAVQAGERKGASILVVEDSITSRMLLKGILESSGYHVKTAVDGLEALTVLRTQLFDLVVSDVEMPRLNGFDLTARIRADKKLGELPVILVTALETREDRERGVDVGANAYLVKSNFDQSNLLEAVRRLA